MTPHLFNPDTGEVELGPAPGCTTCNLALQERLIAEADLQRVERDLRDARREISTLKTKLYNRERQAPQNRAAEALFKYWVAQLDKDPKRTVFGDKRRKAVAARLAEHDPEYIARAIDGLAVSVFTSPQGKRFDDLELVCRDETKLEGFYETAERVDAPSLVGPAWKIEFGSIVEVAT